MYYTDNRDYIEIKNLQIFAHHGVFKEENTLGQPFVVSALLYMDLSKAGLSDELDKSVNYAQVCEEIEIAMTEKTFNLIEAAAEYTARRILVRFPLIDSVRLTIKKPHAPVLKPLDFAAVTINRGRVRAYLGIGSNMGDKKAYLDMAVDAVKSNPLCTNVTVSEYIVTEPVGGVEQDDFLNAVIGFDTLMSPHELLEFANETEKSANRVRTIHWGPRTLDVDILLYGDAVIDDERLTVPHKEMCKRGFVLEPLCEIAPYAVHPIENKTIKTLLSELK